MPVTLAVAVGGALGALARWGADRAVEHRVAGVFPWSTFAINLTGCFLAGLVVAALVDRHHVPAWAAVGAVSGFLGAYTTFSTFAQETYDLADEGHLALALANAALSTTLGVAAVLLGRAAGRLL